MAAMPLAVSSRPRCPPAGGSARPPRRPSGWRTGRTRSRVSPPFGDVLVGRCRPARRSPRGRSAAPAGWCAGSTRYDVGHPSGLVVRAHPTVIARRRRVRRSGGHGRESTVPPDCPESAVSRSPARRAAAGGPARTATAGQDPDAAQTTGNHCAAGPRPGRGSRCGRACSRAPRSASSGITISQPGSPRRPGEEQEPDRADHGGQHVDRRAGSACRSCRTSMNTSNGGGPERRATSTSTITRHGQHDDRGRPAGVPRCARDSASDAGPHAVAAQREQEPGGADRAGQRAAEGADRRAERDHVADPGADVAGAEVAEQRAATR